MGLNSAEATNALVRRTLCAVAAEVLPFPLTVNAFFAGALLLPFVRGLLFAVGFFLGEDFAAGFAAALAGAFFAVLAFCAQAGKPTASANISAVEPAFFNQLPNRPSGRKTQQPSGNPAYRIVAPPQCVSRYHRGLL
jgi:hypothetical protein